MRARARRGEGRPRRPSRPRARHDDRGLRQKRRRDFHGRRGIPIFIIAIRIRRGEKRAYALEIVQRFKRLRLRRRVARAIGLGAGSFFFHALRRANACRDGAKRVSSLLGDGAFFRADFRSLGIPVRFPAPRSRAAFPRSRHGRRRVGAARPRRATRRDWRTFESSKNGPTLASSKRPRRRSPSSFTAETNAMSSDDAAFAEPGAALARPTRRPARRTPATGWTPRCTRRIRRVRRVRRVFTRRDARKVIPRRKHAASARSTTRARVGDATAEETNASNRSSESFAFAVGSRRGRTRRGRLSPTRAHTRAPARPGTSAAPSVQAFQRPAEPRALGPRRAQRRHRDADRRRSIRRPFVGKPFHSCVPSAAIRAVKKKRVRVRFPISIPAP